MTPEENVLADALAAALRWMYLDTAEHVATHAPPDVAFNLDYLNDLASMRAGYQILKDMGRVK